MSKLTKRTVESMEPDSLVWDSEVLGFGCRRQRGPHRKYVLKYRLGGRQRWLSIGTHGAPWTVETARNEARRLLGLVVSGTDPAEVRDQGKAALTVAALCEQFLETYGTTRLKLRTLEEYRRLVRLHITPALGKIRVDRLRRADVAKAHQAMKDTPRAANFTLSVLSKAWAWAQSRGLAPEGSNPARGIERFRENSRERYLSTEEIARLGRALIEAEEAGEITPYAAAAIRLLLFTGCRLREILHLEWAWVDLEREVLRLPDSKTGAKTVHLNAPALAVLAGIKRIEGNPYVICGRVRRAKGKGATGEEQGRPLMDLQKSWQRVRIRAGLEDVRLHDLRHTHASIAAAAGASLPIIGALLGHKEARTTARYSHLSADPLKEASENIGQRIADALSPKPASGNALLPDLNR